MTSAQTNDSRVIQLDARHEHGIVTITPRDEDRFNLRVPEVIRACQQAASDQRTRQRFDFLLKRLGTWVLGRSDVREAFVTIRDGGLCFLVVRKVAAYDADFEDALSEFDIDLAHDSDVGFQIEVMSLPAVSDQSLQSFLNSDLTLRIITNDQRQ